MNSFKVDTLTIDAAAYGSQGNAILGIRDSGKTYTATLFAEKLFDAGVPFVAFDPIGVWRYLRVPGAGAGRPVVVAGGVEGDLALTPASAPAIVEAAMHNGVSLVLDLFSMELSKADWRRIVGDCLRLMLHRNAKHGLRHVFIEEAAEFAPQVIPKDGVTGAVYAEIEKLARMGGNSRLGYTLINQRSEQVNKAILELCENLFLHRQKGRNSLTALAKWLDIGAVDESDKIIATLSSLPTGECWAWMAGKPPVHVKIPRKDSLHPDRRVMRGDADVKAKASVDVGSFVEKMKAALVTVEAEAKANDPKELRKQIGQLQRELAKTTAELAIKRDLAQRAVDQAKPARVEVPVMTDEAKGLVASAREAFSDLCETASSMMDRIRTIGEQFERFASDHEKIVLRFKSGPAVLGAGIRPLPIGAPEAQGIKPVATMRRNGSPSTIGNSGLRRMMIALAQRPGLDKRQLGVRAGMSSSSGTFGTYLGRMRSEGWVNDRGGGCLYITDEGRMALGTYEPLPEGDELRDYWLGQLGDSGAARMLRELCDRFPQTVSADQLGAAVGMSASSGTFGTYLGKLRTLELITGKRDALSASEELFD